MSAGAPQHGPRRAADAEERPDFEVRDPAEALERLLLDLRSRPAGLSSREAARRLQAAGPNHLIRGETRRRSRELLKQLIHPLALLLWAAALLSAVTGTAELAIAIVAVILLNAVFAFVQELHAERAVEALASYLPERAQVLREGEPTVIDAVDLVPGDVVLIQEGDGVSADARIISGSVEIDMSTLTGESQAVLRTPEVGLRPGTPLLEATDVVFSGSTCVGGEATAVVYATGMHTELGRIAALSKRVTKDHSPLEHQVNRAARMIALIAIGMGAAFLPVGLLLADLPLTDTVTFAIGLLVANVPEGLLPTITLALAVGVRVLARSGALVKRISAVETLGSTSVICTDKTGTLTLNRMQVTAFWTPADLQSTAAAPLNGNESGHTASGIAAADSLARRFARASAACSNARLSHTAAATAALNAREAPAEAGPSEPQDSENRDSGDPTEVAMLRHAVSLGAVGDRSDVERITHFHFDPVLRRMSTLDRVGEEAVLHTKGAPEEVLRLCTRISDAEGDRPLEDRDLRRLSALIDEWASEGLRLIAAADRTIRSSDPSMMSREDAERDLTLLGLVGLSDPPRPEAADAVKRCHTAGIRLIVVTGDSGLTAAGIARQVGIGSEGLHVISGSDLDLMSEAELDEILGGPEELVFARTSPEAKLRITDALQSLGHIVAMTGDGVNDAPALRKADIGVAMGRSGTDVAREAATMVLTDDNFASLVAAVEAGRRVYDNVRKFIVYIFAHATPQVIPLLLYAVSGGAIPLPLTVMQILAIDLLTETLPALALGREDAEPGLMDRGPRPRDENVISSDMLIRAWAVMGGVSAALVTSLFLMSLHVGGWTFDAAASAQPERLWQEATTMTFLGIVSCQIGTAMASRTHTESLLRIGPLSNRLLLWGILFEVVLAAAIVGIPPLQAVFGTAPPQPWLLLLLIPLPFLVWGSDEIYKRLRRLERADQSGGR
ncbi:cation-transporting P-type ATPase [Nesterenkonia sp. NBAIMH1]|uniref:cation-translocating P-type ATPase n=1 Tax=Nesterenkonia sp. NBAIMH1 TaxID=2600320 RepID=UPI0011B610A3|nr:cation-transporting P-type ATPase [Nesterenkonia sp. NBAIMH1]